MGGRPSNPSTTPSSAPHHASARVVFLQFEQRRRLPLRHSLIQHRLALRLRRNVHISGQSLPIFPVYRVCAVIVRILVETVGKAAKAAARERASGKLRRYISTTCLSVT